MREEISKDFVKMFTEFSGTFNKNLSEEELNDVATLLWLEYTKMAVNTVWEQYRSIVGHKGHISIGEAAREIENIRLKEIGKAYEAMITIMANFGE